MTTKPNFDYQYEVDRIKSTVFHIGVAADPVLRNYDNFAVILYFQKDDGTVVEVAKVDDTEHDEGEIHVDRYYRERRAGDKDFDVDIENVYDAEEYLRDNW